MALFNVAQWDETDEVFLDPPLACFVCGQILADDVLIVWQGSRPNLWAREKFE
jgi:hypothetical protein